MLELYKRASTAAARPPTIPTLPELPDEPAFWLVVDAAVAEAAVPVVAVVVTLPAVPVLVTDPVELLSAVEVPVAVAVDVQDTALGTVTPKLPQNLTA